MPDGFVTLFFAGDVMTGRGIDQILPHPNRPDLYEPVVRSALTYVELAERVSGAIARPVTLDYIWGDALAELTHRQPEARIVNLETAVTTCDDAWPGKGIHYRMHPAHIGCLQVAGIDCCTLANNHVLDWGYAGLAETLATLRVAGIGIAGAGYDENEARAPAIVALPAGRRVIVFACALASAGVPQDWTAIRQQPGVWRLPDLDAASVTVIATAVAAIRRTGDIVAVSIHWGGNWGYDVTRAQRSFARRLVDEAGVDVVHGHSSHHPKGIEIYRDRLILYGCGDLLNDYEGIGGYEAFRGELGLMYFPVFDASGALEALTLVPTRMRKLRITRATGEDAAFVTAMLERECRAFGTRIERDVDDALIVERR